jgi:hypothetical protein
LRCHLLESGSLVAEAAARFNARTN